MKDTDIILAYVDGACKGNPGKGGWGIYLKAGNQTKSIYGGNPNTTNNRMELTAAINTLLLFKDPVKIIITTDSEYVKKGITEYIHNWYKNGWKNSNKKEIKNIDLWKRLYELTKFHTVNWKWVKGHNGNVENTIADELANKGCQSI